MTVLSLPGYEVLGVRADNPGPFTLSGTNSWLVGRDPTWLIDPGPPLPGHIQALNASIAERGGLGGIALTHDHPDHAEGLPGMRRHHPGVPLAAVRGEVDVRLADGDRFGPLQALPVPGHAADHIVLLVADDALAAIGGRAAFSGDAVLGEGSVFVAPSQGGLAGYLSGLRRLQARSPSVIFPGHGPVISEPAAKLSAYIEHRLEREHRLLVALAEGLRSTDELLARVWSDAPTALRPAAAVTLAAHLEKLEQEGRLPPGTERPVIAWL